MPFITSTPILDRDILKRGNKLATPTQLEIEKHPLRPFFINGEDLKIADVLFRYFSSVRDKWPTAWNTDERGLILNRTNGFRALMRALKPICNALKPHKEMPTKDDFDTFFSKVKINDKEFTIDNFKPGTSGESLLFKRLIEDMGLANQKTLI